MEKEKKGRQYQDTVFRMYFNKEARLKEVAGALHGRSYKVKFHNIAYDNAKILLQRSRSIHDYSFFIARIKRNMAAGMERAQAIREAMRYCEESDIMKEFLQQHEREVVDMVNFEWNQKDFEEAILEEGMERGRAEGMERGMECGRAEGMEQGKVDIVLEMLRDKLPLETIARISKFSMERVQELGRMHSLL